MESANGINTYTCEKCGKDTVTINDCDGVTPFLIQCKVNNIGCGGYARSNFYRVDQNLTPGWEWYKPDANELETLDEDWKAHIAAGGLKLRKLDAQRRESRYGINLRQD